MGIDIGGLDAAIVAGFPGSFSSFWQQSGRAGRRQTESVVVFIASSSPLDQFIITHPDYFFDRPHETAQIDPENPYVLTDHVKCAAFELPFTDAELTSPHVQAAFPPETVEILSALEEDGIVRHTAGRWHWSDRSFPSEGISLRSATADNVVIVDITEGRNTVIGEMDRPSAKEMLFPNAVYIHLGRQYMVTLLDIPNRRAEVTEVEINYFTDGVVKTDIQVLTEDSIVSYLPEKLSIAVGDILVRTQVAKFKKLRFHTHENIGFGEIALDAEEMETRGVMLLLDNRFFPLHDMEGSGLDDADLGEILSGMGTLMRSVAPVFLLCDSRDIGVWPRIRDLHFSGPVLYFFDRVPGGSGLADAFNESLPAIIQASIDQIQNCPCEYGCPSCIGVHSENPLIKSSAAGLLKNLVSGSPGDKN
ncbi:DUF1998 domain-containing protein [Brucepastera parasyntrophica]|uniref:DEAD/DEAH box helicase n=1 Tax=Brucepastera parasyntrophica TaxID=2880008 RepID=UPI002109D38B|nr:Zn-binding domain-containing protein [Brucepastera parasyntrophica]ULQ60077.1 DUF1998 domain-containing protein [Brucepastera parasyntrophica]